jgi:hypothetical protein
METLPMDAGAAIAGRSFHAQNLGDLRDRIGMGLGRNSDHCQSQSAGNQLVCENVDLFHIFCYGRCQTLIRAMQLSFLD